MEFLISIIRKFYLWFLKNIIFILFFFLLILRRERALEYSSTVLQKNINKNEKVCIEFKNKCVITHPLLFSVIGTHLFKIWFTPGNKRLIVTF